MDSVAVDDRGEHINGMHKIDQAPADLHAGRRRIPDKFPPVALLILVVELGERFTYFGLSGPLQNYINNPYVPGSDLPGALGKGQAVASALGNFFKFWAYASTIIGAIVAGTVSYPQQYYKTIAKSSSDQYVGKFKAITISLGVYIIGLTILVATATPAGIHSNAGFGGLVAAMVIIGLGTGGIKANVTPMCAEQYQNAEPVLKTLKTGEIVVVDPELTIQRLFMWFYWVVNVGALSPLITVNVEAKASFWLAYLIPLIAICLSAIVFLSGQKRYVKVLPQGSAIIDACKVLNIVRQEKHFHDAKPSSLEAAGRLSKYPFASSSRYTDQYVSDIWNNLISQAGQMALHGTPNDLLQNLDPIALCIFIPLLDCASPHNDKTKTSAHNHTFSGALSIPPQIQNQLQPSPSHLYRFPACFSLHGLRERVTTLYLHITN
ncbi:hypothetical protein PENARI_c003G06352 [Penicillium arizonense]|uniref:Uncharacterized protein n=1 Tax=Penicillium arizonense TaxID=1835702 RepID=A0A1F5LSG7_PENAI|nr:hypothetical protein PENARI_c003G06352 [Penicillium arizonense]OGE55889.1 hypothetical protein PENARI_c003G06352 [Penicillium arizonense]